MPRFRKRFRPGQSEAAAAATRFWSWWSSAAPLVTRAADAGDDEQLAALLTGPVQTLHPELRWQVGSGVTARHLLVISGGGDPALRAITQRWRSVGPPDDALWEFHPAAPPQPARFASPARIAGVDLDPQRALALAAVDDGRCRVDLAIYHPAFPALDELTRSQAANVLTGWALGEDDIERWVGRLSVATVPPLDGVPVSVLSALTSQLAERWSCVQWAVLEGSFGARRMIADVRFPLHRVDYPLFDEHVAVRLPYRDALPDGLPADDARTELAAFEEAVLADTGGQAVLVARQTASGERLLHLYADSTASPARTIRRMLGTYPAGGATLQTQRDPGWQAVDHLRVLSRPDQP